MRGLRVFLAAVVLATIPAAALAQQGGSGRDAQFAMRDFDCSGMTVVGHGLRARQVVHLTMVDRDSGRVLLRRNVRTSTGGRFALRLKASTKGVMSVRVLISTNKGRVGWVDHTTTKAAAMCRLPFTGPFRPSLALVSSVLIAGGLLVLRRTRGRNAYWPTAA
jgi:hypothetical protein